MNLQENRNKKEQEKQFPSAVTKELYFSLLENDKKEWQRRRSATREKRKLYYISAEFLIGKIIIQTT